MTASYKNPTPPGDFADFVRRLREGENVAWTEVYKMLLPRVRAALCQRYGSDCFSKRRPGEEAVDSAVGSVFRRLQAGSYEFETAEALTGMFIEVAKRKYLHKRKRQDRCLGLSEPQQVVDLRNRVSEATLLEIEFQKHVHEVIDEVCKYLKSINVSHPQIFPYRLYAEKGERLVEIAQRFDCSISTVSRVNKLAMDYLKSKADDPGWLERLGGGPYA